VHSPEVERIGKGKARKPCQLGVKAAAVILRQTGQMVGARSFPGNRYDGHILSAVLEQAANLLEDVPGKIKVVVADLGFRGEDGNVSRTEIIHRSKFMNLNPQQMAWLHRRQAVEPAIGHLSRTTAWTGAGSRGLWAMRCTRSAARRATACAGCCGPSPGWATRRPFLCLLQRALLPAKLLRAVQTGRNPAQLGG
jgi:hypothetical protein